MIVASGRSIISDRPDAILQRWASVAREKVRAGFFAASPWLAGMSLEAESSRLRFDRTPQLFAPDLGPISPTLNDDLLELYGRSEQVLLNRFGFFGETKLFEAQVNWRASDRQAWQTELHSFDYALDLALTLRISGDPSYGRHLRYLIADWISANPPGKRTGWNPLGLARRIRNWILAADLARDAFESQADFLELFTTSLRHQATYLSWTVGETADRRSRLAASRALLLASRYFFGSGAMEYGELGRELLFQAVAEGPASYPDHPQPLRQFELACACAEHSLFANDAASSEWTRAQLRGSLETLEWMLHPDGTLPLFGREPLPLPDAVSALFAIGATVLGVARWKSLAGDELGILPYMLLGESGRRQFDELPHQPWHAGSHLDTETGICRLGDGEASALLVSAIPRSSRCDQQDLFSYELTSRGQRAVVDSGIYRPLDGTVGGDFASPRSHNVLLLDGEPWGATFEQRVHFSPLNNTNTAQGVWLMACLERGLSSKEPPGNCISRRGFFLIDRCFWVVLDFVEGVQAQKVESLIHFYPAFTLESRGQAVIARSGGALLAVLPIQEQPQSAAKHVISKDGWYCPAPGVRYSTQVLELEWTDVRQCRVLGYIIGARANAGSPTATVRTSQSAVVLVIDGVEYPLEVPTLG